MLSQGWVLSGGWDGQGNSGDTFDPSALGSWFGWRWTGYVVLRGCWAVGVQRVGGTGRKSYRVEAWSRRWSRDQGGGCGMDQGGEAGQWGSFRARQRVLKQGFATGFGQYCFDSGVHRALALGTSTLTAGSHGVRPWAADVWSGSTTRPAVRRGVQGRVGVRDHVAGREVTQYPACFVCRAGVSDV